MMPSLADHQSNNLTKLLLIGDAKTGKTGSLVSLVKTGYHLRILDFDNLLDSLKYQVLRECPDMLGNVEYRTLRDRYKQTPLGPALDGRAQAFVNAMKMLDKWSYDDVDLGTPAEWGSDCILVIDSLSRMCDAAYDFHFNIARPGKSGEIDGRAIYGAAQDAVEMVLSNLTSDTFKTNVIIIAHIAYQDQPDGTKKGFPQGVGQKLSPKIPQYFSSVVLYTNVRDKRTIKTNSTALVDLANPKPFEMSPELPIETGLATFFQTLRGPTTAATEADRPKAVTLKRRM
jgi:AAA domain